MPGDLNLSISNSFKNLISKAKGLYTHKDVKRFPTSDINKDPLERLRTAINQFIGEYVEKYVDRTKIDPLLARYNLYKYVEQTWGLNVLGTENYYSDEYGTLSREYGGLCHKELDKFDSSLNTLAQQNGFNSFFMWIMNKEKEMNKEIGMEKEPIDALFLSMKKVELGPEDEALINFAINLAIDAPEEAWLYADSEGKTALSILTQLVINKLNNMERYKLIDKLAAVANSQSLHLAIAQLAKDKSLLNPLFKVIEKYPINQILIDFAEKVAACASEEAWEQVGKESDTALRIVVGLAVDLLQTSNSIQIFVPNEFIYPLIKVACEKASAKSWNQLLKDESLFDTILSAMDEYPDCQMLIMLMQKKVEYSSLVSLMNLVEKHPHNKKLIHAVQKVVVHAEEKCWMVDKDESPLMILMSTLLSNPGNTHLIDLVRTAMTFSPQKTRYKIELQGRFKNENALRYLSLAFSKDPNNPELFNIIKQQILHAEPSLLIKGAEKNGKFGCDNPLMIITEVFIDKPRNKNISYLAAILALKITEKKAWEDLYKTNEIKMLKLQNSDDMLNDDARDFIKNIRSYVPTGTFNTSFLRLTKKVQMVSENPNSKKVYSLLQQEADQISDKDILEFIKKNEKEISNKRYARDFISVMVKRGKSFTDKSQKTELAKALSNIYCSNRQCDSRKYHYSSFLRHFGAFSKSEKTDAAKSFCDSDGKTLKPAAKQGLLGQIASLSM